MPEATGTWRALLSLPRRGRVASAASRVGCALPPGRVDCFENPRKIAIHVAVPESQHTKPSARETVITNHIPRGVGIIVVLTSIKLDRDSVFHADKVNDKSLARRLTPKVVAAPSPRSQMHPQLHL